MIYPSDFEAKIGFSSLRQLLISKCIGSAGKALAESLYFSSDFSLVSKWLHQTSEMKALIESGSDYPRPQFYDIAPTLNRIRAVGAYAEPAQLMNIYKSMVAFHDVRAFFTRQSGDSSRPQFPYLAEVFSPLSEFPSLCSLISRSINKFGDVADNASEGLYKVRTQLNAAQGAAARAMRRAVERAVAAGIIDRDTTPAVRDGRMVIPVAAGAKRSLDGIVHDESATGKTVFIEPSEVVEASNHVRQLEMEERREVIAVLVSITDEIRPFVDQILDSYNILSQLDFISAKARIAIDTGGTLPNLHDNVEIDWFGAIHPVLYLSLKAQNRDVVPLTLHLDDASRFLIVSGPNAGGKSVVLKTVGIVQYMAQCGMLPTLFDNSHMGLFKSIFVDIGDEQSIENDLSTYSSHLRNMKYFLSHADARTLVLADEMGSGTEPLIGGALAQAILERLSESHCFGIVTTHYQNLKTFADEHEGFVNGAMIYDRQHLRPTFQLAVGHPGSSFALEIARNIGLPSQVLDSAKEIVGSDYVNLDKYLLDIERDRRYWSNKRQNIREKEQKLNQLLAKYEDTSADLRQKRSQILADARKQAEEILSGANSRIESTIREIRNVQAEKERTKLVRKELNDYRQSLKEDQKDADDIKLLKPLKHKSRTPVKSMDAVAKPEKYIPAVGDFVKMEGGGVPGQILSLQGKKAEVAFGSLRTFVEVSRLKPSTRPKPSASSQTAGISSETFEQSRRRQLDFRQEIDVRGLRADEALQAVSYYIDDALQFNAGRVRILHGTGHGILKTLIREQLKSNPAIESFGDEDVRFGGAGITVVNFK